MKNKYYFILVLFFLLLPLGILTENPAWGEWDLEYYKKVLGYIPQGLKEAKGIDALIPDYSIEGLNSMIGYYLSGIIGVFLIYLSFFILFKVIKRNQR